MDQYNQQPQDQQFNGQTNPPEEIPQYQQPPQYQQAPQYQQQPQYQPAPQYQQPPQYPQPPQYYRNDYSGAQGAPVSKGKCIASMVLGIIALVFYSTSIIALVLAIIAVVLGVKGRKEHPQGVPGRGMATAGLVLGIIAIVFSTIVTIVYIVAIANADRLYYSFFRLFR